MQHGMSFLSVNVSGSTLWLLQLLHYVSNHLKIEEESQSFASSFFFGVKGRNFHHKFWSRSNVNQGL